MKKISLTCPACHQPFHSRTKRSWFIKHILYFLPFKVYFCKCCDKDVYILFQQHQEIQKNAA